MAVYVISASVTEQTENILLTMLGICCYTGARDWVKDWSYLGYVGKVGKERMYEMDTEDLIKIELWYEGQQILI